MKGYSQLLTRYICYPIYFYKNKQKMKSNIKFNNSVMLHFPYLGCTPFLSPFPPAQTSFSGGWGGWVAAGGWLLRLAKPKPDPEDKPASRSRSLPNPFPYPWSIPDPQPWLLHSQGGVAGGYGVWISRSRSQPGATVKPWAGGRYGSRDIKLIYLIFWFYCNYYCSYHS